MEELIDAVIEPSVATLKSQIDEPVVADLDFLVDSYIVVWILVRLLLQYLSA